MTSDFTAGNYRFIPAVFQYSSGVAANPGFEVERVRFDRPVPLAEGFARIAKYIQDSGRPLTSFCACELRSPAAFTEEGFRNFNLHYVKTLGEWGIYDGKTNPVARSNVCPEIDPPAEPSFYAFSFTRPSQNTTPSFVIAGSGESQEGSASYAERTVRYRDVSPDYGTVSDFKAFVRARIPADCSVEFVKHKGSRAIQLPYDMPSLAKAKAALSKEWGREAVTIGEFLHRVRALHDPNILAVASASAGLCATGLVR